MLTRLAALERNEGLVLVAELVADNAAPVRDMTIGALLAAVRRLGPGRSGDLLRAAGVPNKAHVGNLSPRARKAIITQITQVISKTRYR